MTLQFSVHGDQQLKESSISSESPCSLLDCPLETILCRFLNDFKILRRNPSEKLRAIFPPSLPPPPLTIPELIDLQGDVWICMELMDTSLDKFYKQVIDKGQTIPEDILGKIAVSVSTS